MRRRAEYNLRRNQFMSRYNVRVLRFENRAVFEHPDGVVIAIKSNLMNPTTTSGPLLNSADLYPYLWLDTGVHAFSPNGAK